MENKRTRELSEEELTTLREEVDKYTIEGDLRRFNALNIKRLRDIGCYRGRRHAVVSCASWNCGRQSPLVVLCLAACWCCPSKHAFAAFRGCLSMVREQRQTPGQGKARQRLCLARRNRLHGSWLYLTHTHVTDTVFVQQSASKSQVLAVLFCSLQLCFEFGTQVSIASMTIIHLHSTYLYAYGISA